MNYHHKNLTRGRWQTLSFAEQMANIGSEVERALSWRKKNNLDYSKKAFERSLELIDLTLQVTQPATHLKEITRLREILIDYFLGSNQFKSSDESWRKYFLCFAYAARRNH